MNSITRLILRRVISGNVTLTPQVLAVLKECDEHQPPAGTPENAASEPPPPAESSDRDPPPDEKHLTFVNPLPGRWIRRTECGVGVALLLAASLAQPPPAPATWETANERLCPGQYTVRRRTVTNPSWRSKVIPPLCCSIWRMPNSVTVNWVRPFSITNAPRCSPPNDPDIAANLKFARQKAGLEPERQSPVQKAARALTMNDWFWVAATALFFLAAAFPVKQLRPQLRPALNWCRLAAALAFAFAATAIAVRRSDLHRAVVIASEATAAVSPVTLAQPVFKLRTGEIVTLEQAHGDFARIRNQAGHAGWVKLGQIALIIPASATTRGS